MLQTNVISHLQQPQQKQQQFHDLQHIYGKYGNASSQNINVGGRTIPIQHTPSNNNYYVGMRPQSSGLGSAINSNIRVNTQVLKQPIPTPVVECNPSIASSRFIVPNQTNHPYVRNTYDAGLNRQADAKPGIRHISSFKEQLLKMKRKTLVEKSRQYLVKRQRVDDDITVPIDLAKKHILTIKHHLKAKQTGVRSPLKIPSKRKTPMKKMRVETGKLIHNNIIV